MERNESEKYLFCAMEIGEQLLISGAEVGRVEDTIRRICMAYGASRVDVFSITSSIVTTMYVEGFDAVTQTRRVSGMANDMYKLDGLNQLSRRICAEKLDPEEIMAELERIKNGPRYTTRQMAGIYALNSGCFCVFFGGNLKDMVVSAAIGVCLKYLEALIQRGSVNRLVTAFLCSLSGGFLANMAVKMRLGTQVDMISIGNVMLLIPGLVFTNSLRDMFSGDTITGLIRFLESIILATIIALGFALAGFLF